MSPKKPKQTKIKAKFPSLFYACYLLISQAPARMNSVYIGSTPDPVRRLRQHNGEIQGGAKKTASKRPWEMEMVVYGFQSKIAALQFEWCWQNPHKSRHFKEFKGTSRGFSGKAKEKYLPMKLLALETMLKNVPFNRWPLNIHFNSEDLFKQFSQKYSVPAHVRITCGTLNTLPYDQDAQVTLDPRFNDSANCFMCDKVIQLSEDPYWLACLTPDCLMVSHLRCLSQHFLEEETGGGGTLKLIPMQGSCPNCQTELKWGKLIHEMKARQIVQQGSTPDSDNEQNISYSVDQWVAQKSICVSDIETDLEDTEEPQPISTQPSKTLKYYDVISDDDSDDADLKNSWNEYLNNLKPKSKKTLNSQMGRLTMKDVL